MEKQTASKNVVGTQRDGGNQQAQMKQHGIAYVRNLLWVYLL